MAEKILSSTTVKLLICLYNHYPEARSKLDDPLMIQAYTTSNCAKLDGLDLFKIRKTLSSITSYHARRHLTRCFTKQLAFESVTTLWFYLSVMTHAYLFSFFINISQAPIQTRKTPSFKSNNLSPLVILYIYNTHLHPIHQTNPFFLLRISFAAPSFSIFCQRWYH